MRVAPAGTDPVVTQAVATQCTLPVTATLVACVMSVSKGAGAGLASNAVAGVVSGVVSGVAAGVTAPDPPEAVPVPPALVAVAVNL